MPTLDPEENLIALVARATCFAYRVDADEVSESDVRLYVDELIALYRRKPDARSPGDEPVTVAESLRFCAEQLTDVAPEHAARLRDELEKDR